MRSMLFQGEAGDAKKSIIAGKTDDAKLLFWMDLAKSLVESRFRAIAPWVEPFPKRCNFFGGLIMRLELLIAGAHWVITKLILILIFRQAILFLPLLLDQGDEHMIGKLIYRVQIVIREFNGPLAMLTPRQDGLWHRWAEFMIGKCKAFDAEGMIASQPYERSWCLLALLALLSLLRLIRLEFYHRLL